MVISWPDFKKFIINLGEILTQHSEIFHKEFITDFGNYIEEGSSLGYPVACTEQVWEKERCEMRMRRVIRLHLHWEAGHAASHACCRQILLFFLCSGSNLGDLPGAEVAIQAGQSSFPCKIDSAGQMQARLGQNHMLSLILADHLDCCPTLLSVNCPNCACPAMTTSLRCRVIRGWPLWPHYGIGLLFATPLLTWWSSTTWSNRILHGKRTLIFNIASLRHQRLFQCPV